MVDNFPVDNRLDLRILGLIGNSLEGNFGVALGLVEAVLAFAAGREGIIAAGMRSWLVEGIGSLLALVGSLGLALG